MLLDALDRTMYRDWAELTHGAKPLYHQDFAAGNTTIGREQGWSEEKHADRLRRMIATELDKERVLAEFLARLDEVAVR